MAGRIVRPQPDPVSLPRVDFIACRRGGYDPTADVRLEQDMDAMLEAEVEYFDHPTLGRVRLVDLLVATGGSIEEEQQATERSV